MDILYCTGWLYASNRHKGLGTANPGDLPWASASSSVGRLLLALTIIAVIVGMLGHAARDTDLHTVASTIQPSQWGTPK